MGDVGGHGVQADADHGGEVRHGVQLDAGGCEGNVARVGQHGLTEGPLVTLWSSGHCVNIAISPDFCRPDLDYHTIFSLYLYQHEKNNIVVTSIVLCLLHSVITSSTHLFSKICFMLFFQ